MINADLLALLECPKCQGSVKTKSGALACSECHLKFPMVGDIPWIFRTPEESLKDWRNRADFQLKSFAFEMQRLDLESANRDGPKSRLERFKRLREGYGHNLKVLKSLVQPLFSVRDIKVELYKAVKTQLPLTQKFMSYYSNLHRDWVWGDKENKASMDLLRDLGAIPEGASVLILGSGASRLAYDLHQESKAGMTVALDVNPLLLLSASVIVRGKSMALYEFPIAPKSLQDVCVLGEARAPSPVREGFEFVFADGMQPPFKANSFDVVLTPWFIDVVPQELERMAVRINRIIKPGGHWWNFGPFGFLTSAVREQLSLEEVLEVVDMSGFNLKHKSVDQIPYLQSPHSCQERFERVLSFSAEKIKHMESIESYSFLPEWLEDWTLPIPIDEAVNRYRYATEVQFQILSAVDGQCSLNQIADAFASKHQISPEEAQGAIFNLFSQILEG